MVLLRSKLVWVAVIVLALGGVTGVIDVPWPKGHQRLGPRHPGFNDQFKCRYATLEIEAGSELDDPPDAYHGRLTADLGSAGKIVNERVVIPEWYDKDRAYQREFCARPRSVLTAHVHIEQPASFIDCRFMTGPDIEEDTISGRDNSFLRPDDPPKLNTGDPSRSENKTEATCSAVMP